MSDEQITGIPHVRHTCLRLLLRWQQMCAFVLPLLAAAHVLLCSPHLAPSPEKKLTFF